MMLSNITFEKESSKCHTELKVIRIWFYECKWKKAAKSESDSICCIWKTWWITQDSLACCNFFLQQKSTQKLPYGTVLQYVISCFWKKFVCDKFLGVTLTKWNNQSEEK